VVGCDKNLDFSSGLCLPFLLCFLCGFLCGFFCLFSRLARLLVVLVVLILILYLFGRLNATAPKTCTGVPGGIGVTCWVEIVWSCMNDNHAFSNIAILVRIKTDNFVRNFES